MTRKREGGQALVAATAILGIVLMGFAGLGIDMGYMRYQKRLQQTAADSAALAGAAEIPFAGDYTAAAKHDAATNGFTDGANNVTVTVNSPPQSGPHNAVAGYVEVSVADIQPTFFMRILGINNETVTARAVANGNASSSTGCIYTLDHSGNSLNFMAGTINLVAPSCGILVDSNFSLLNVGSGTISVASIGVAGTYTHGNVTPTPAPVTGIVPAPDPLSYLTPPAGGGCLMNPIAQGNTATLTMTPGNYCNGMTFQAGTDNITFSPGTYEIGGNGLLVQGNTATLTGNGVTIYQYAGTMDIGPGTLTANLTAPTTGPLAGILLWQAASDTNTATIHDTTANSVLQGALYFPGATLFMGNDNNTAAYSFFVVKDLTVQGTTINLSNDTSSLSGGSPIKTSQLVE